MVNRRGAMLALMAVAVTPFAVTATKITLRGKLFATEEESANGTFFIDPDGESESITIGAQGYVRDYLGGCVGRTVDITIEPKA